MSKDAKLLEEIQEMEEDELVEYITEKSDELGIDFDPDMLDGCGKQPLYDFIADNIHPEFQGELHSECKLSPGCSMFPNAETDEDIEDEMEHVAAK